MRRFLAGTVLTLIVLGSADVASAKGPDEASLDGPGLVRPLDLRGDDADSVFWQLVEQSRFWSALDAEPAPRSSSKPIDLGPGYLIAWSMSYDPHGGSLRQLLYPFAVGGPWVYTPGHQELHGMPADRGWHRAAITLTATLRDLGIAAPADSRGGRQVRY